MNIYFVRHGQTQLNLDGVYYGFTDCDINEKGIKQSKKLAVFFDSIKIENVYTSDLFRAVHTAQLIINKKGLLPIEKKGLREINFGDWENKTFAEIQKTQNIKKWYDDWETFVFPNGESFFQFYERVVLELKNILEKETKENILIVSHSGPLSVMLCELTGVGKEGFWRFKIEQGAYSLVTVEKGRYVIEKINQSV